MTMDAVCIFHGSNPLGNNQLGSPGMTDFMEARITRL